MNSTTTPEEAEARKSPEEIMIRADLYEAAMHRALFQGETLASVTRACYFAAAALAKPVEGGKAKLRPRPYGEPRERIRFRVPKEQRAAARESIESAGISVPAAVEQMLEYYVEHGSLIGVAALVIPEPPTPETETTTEHESE
jgi:predicted HicB family RNase H-like nuclease